MFTSLLDAWLHRPTIIFECERCGTTVAHANDTCPYCVHTRIATLEV